jgi:hypothetical protein
MSVDWIGSQLDRLHGSFGDRKTTLILSHCDGVIGKITSRDLANSNYIKLSMVVNGPQLRNCREFPCQKNELPNTKNTRTFVKIESDRFNASTEAGRALFE